MVIALAIQQILEPIHHEVRVVLIRHEINLLQDGMEMLQLHVIMDLGILVEQHVIELNDL
jgi:hypothetical protein